jgi:hypothetical protein
MSTTPPFPSLKTIVEYGLYTVRELEKWHRGEGQRRDVVVLNECPHCDFVFRGNSCDNCVLSRFNNKT